MNFNLQKSDTRWMAIFIAIAVCIIVLFVLFEPFINRIVGASLGFFQGPYLVALVIILILAFDVILPIPASVVCVAASAMLGFYGGVSAIWIGLMLGCIFGYWLGAKCNSLLLRKLLTTKEINRAADMSGRFGCSMLVIMRAVPVLAETSVITAGMVRMPITRFLLTCGLANAGVAITFAYIGSLATQENSLGLAILGSIAIPAIACGGFKIFHMIGKRKNTTLVKLSTK